MKKLAIIGASGHGKVIGDLVLKLNLQSHLYSEIGYIDDRTMEKGPFDLPYIGKLEAFLKSDEAQEYDYIIAIGNNSIRARIASQIAEKLGDACFGTLIHPEATIGHEVTIGSGTVILARVVVNSYTSIGKHAIINTGSIIEHDNIIGDYVHVAPGCTFTGNVYVDDEAFVGAGSTVINQVRIGSRAFIGAGSVVLRSIPEGVKAYGVPARVITS